MVKRNANVNLHKNSTSFLCNLHKRSALKTSSLSVADNRETFKYQDETKRNCPVHERSALHNTMPKLCWYRVPSIQKQRV